MASQPDGSNIPPPREPIIDPRTGLISRSWYRWFLQVFKATGGGGSTITINEIMLEPSPFDQQASLPDNLESALPLDILAPLYEFAQQVQTVPPLDVGAILSIDARLQALEQGPAQQAVVPTTNLAFTPGNTAMVSGFLNIPAASGVPTGTPTSPSGTVPMYFNTATGDFYIYSSTWKKVTLT